MLSWREFFQSLDATQLFLAALSGVGVAFLWMKRRYSSFAEWKKVREARRLAFQELPSRVSDFAELLGDVRRQSEETLGVLATHTKSLEGQDRVLSGISAMVHGEMELDPTPRFICDNDGRNLNVNTAYARLVGCGRDELLGFGYQRFMLPGMNIGYMQEFHDAARQHRSFEGSLNIRRPDGTMISAYVRAVPHPEENPPAHYWVGVVAAARNQP